MSPVINYCVSTDVQLGRNPDTVVKKKKKKKKKKKNLIKIKYKFTEFFFFFFSGFCIFSYFFMWIF